MGKTDDAKKDEKTDDAKKEEKTEEIKDKEEEKKDGEEAKEKEKEEEAKESDEAMEEGDETGTEGEEEGEESSDEKKEEGEKAHLEERLCSTMLALGEVSIENENYKQAVDDIQDCLKKQANLPKDARIVAETYYQLGVAQGFNAQHDEAVESLKSAINIIQERIKNMEKTETEEAKKEVTELKALVPEIEEKINDTKDMKKEAENKKEDTSASGDAFGSKVAEVKPVSSI